MKDIQEQKPYSVSQIESTKPNVPKSTKVLSGYITNSFNGGHNKTIAYKKIMAGERHNAYRLKTCLQLLTPLTPAFQTLRATIYTYFVPNSRVWTNAEKFTAQKGGATTQKIESYPNFGGKRYPNVKIGNDYYNITMTEKWRDCFAASYMPRVGVLTPMQREDQASEIPAINALPLRGRIAIYNDYERNKQFEPELSEFKGNEVSQIELDSYMPLYSENIDLYEMRAKAPNSYYTDYRTELQGLELPSPDGAAANEDVELLNWQNWESYIAEARAESENSELNDWDIISKIRGSRKLTEGKVQLLSKKTVPINYSAVTQSAYNTNSEIREDFQVMGKQGAYSYTEVDMLLYSGVEFIEEGFLHIIVNVAADSCFETGIDRTLLDIKALDEYRPDLKDKKTDVIYSLEYGTGYAPWLSQIVANYAIGFKRAYSQYFKLPNVCGGDMMSVPYKSVANDYETVNDTELIPNDTYTFFRNSANYYTDYMQGVSVQIKQWKDYTDLMINRNQAIKQDICSILNEDTSEAETRVMGHNQIFMVGMHQVYATLPIDNAISENYQKWGEH